MGKITFVFLPSWILLPPCILVFRSKTRWNFPLQSFGKLLGILQYLRVFGHFTENLEVGDEIG